MLTLIIGTNRPNSNTSRVAKHVEEAYKALGVSLQILDLHLLPPEIFAPTSYAEKPKVFHPFAQTILESDGLIVVTPEYNGSIPGILKYFIDMLKFPESFEKRPVCFVGLSAGVWGALRPIEQLQQIFNYRNAFVYPVRVFLPNINSFLNEGGRLADAELLARLESQARGYIDFVERLKGIRLR